MRVKASIVKEAICLDANIFVAALSPDEATEERKQFLDTMVQTHIAIWEPSLFLFEIFSVLSKKKIMKILDDSLLYDAQCFIFNLPIVQLWNEELMQKTLEFQESAGLSFYDATYLATASLKACPLITEDKELIKKGKRAYPSIFSADRWAA
jgi:predicted nucleic acid-binding protein